MRPWTSSVSIEKEEVFPSIFKRKKKKAKFYLFPKSFSKKQRSFTSISIEQILLKKKVKIQSRRVFVKIKYIPRYIT